MDIGKDSRFFKMYADCWNFMKEYSKATTLDDTDGSLAKIKEMCDRYPEYWNYVEASLFHFMRIVENEVKANGKPV